MNNLATRTIAGIGFIVVMLACLLLNKFAFLALLLFMTGVMMHEFYHMTMGTLYKPQRVVAIVAGLSAVLGAYLVADAAMITAATAISVFMILAVATMASTIFSSDRENIGRMGYLLSGMLYIPGPIALFCIPAFASGKFCGTLILCFFVLIWCSDVFAYCLGTAFGQKATSKKLCPAISPKKSWIGFWGGVLGAAAGAAVLSLTGLMGIDLLHSIILGVVVSVAGVAGDLFESEWKRHFNFKDSGNIIPGHGGLLDRFDSTLLAMPIFVAYLLLFNLI